MPNMMKTKRVVLTGLLFAIVLILAMIENAVAIPVAIPGVKLGLSNIVVMYSLFFLGRREALLQALLKAGFVFVTRGAVAAFLSLCGGLLSVGVMILLLAVFKDKISYTAASIFGAVFHNIGQFVAISIVYTSLYLWSYLPLLVIAGVIAGVATSALLRFSLPVLKKLGSK